MKSVCHTVITLHLSLEKERQFFLWKKPHSLKDIDQHLHVLQVYTRHTMESHAPGAPLLCKAAVQLPAASPRSRAGRGGSCSHSMQNSAEMIIFK